MLFATYIQEVYYSYMNPRKENGETFYTRISPIFFKKKQTKTNSTNNLFLKVIMNFFPRYVDASRLFKQNAPFMSNFKESCIKLKKKIK